MKLKTESYIDPLTVEFFENNGTSSTSKDARERQMDGQTNGHKFNTSLVEVIILIKI